MKSSPPKFSDMKTDCSPKRNKSSSPIETIIERNSTLEDSKTNRQETEEIIHHLSGLNSPKDVPVNSPMKQVPDIPVETEKAHQLIPSLTKFSPRDISGFSTMNPENFFRSSLFRNSLNKNLQESPSVPKLPASTNISHGSSPKKDLFRENLYDNPNTNKDAEDSLRRSEIYLPKD
jgi:hypothetical protein